MTAGPHRPVMATPEYAASTVERERRWLALFFWLEAPEGEPWLDPTRYHGPLPLPDLAHKREGSDRRQ